MYVCSIRVGQQSNVTNAESDMLILRSSKGEVYNLYTHSEHIVGRKGVNLELSNDTSVSRKHACIEISVKCNQFTVLLRDLGSKYGTFVNENPEKLPANNPVSVQVGDRIRFGLQWNTWRIESVRLVVCWADSVLGTEQSELAVLVDGTVTSDWSAECTHLVMSRSIVIDTKVIEALLSSKPIVSIAYFRKLKEALSNRRPSRLPDCKNFIPALDELPLDISGGDYFQTNVSRKQLFSGYTFYFDSGKRKSRFKSIIPLAGGVAKEETEQEICRDIIKEKDKSKLIVACGVPAKNTEKPLSAINKALCQSGIRPVSDAEIALSAIYCSTEKFCNPTYTLQNFDEALLSQISAMMDCSSTGSIDINDDDDVDMLIASLDDNISLALPAASLPDRSVVDSSSLNSSKRQEESGLSLFSSLAFSTETKKGNSSVCSSRNSVCGDVLNADRNKRTSANSSSKHTAGSIFAFPSSETLNIRPTCTLDAFFKKNSSFASSVADMEKSSTDLFTSLKAQKRKSIIDETDNAGLKGSKTMRLSSINDTCSASKSFQSNLAAGKGEARKMENMPKMETDNIPEENSQYISKDVPANVPAKLDDSIPEEDKELLNKTVVITKPLVVDKPTSQLKPAAGGNGTVNFKKFRKVAPRSSNALPQIIGGSDLFPHGSSQTSKWDESCIRSRNSSINVF